MIPILVRELLFATFFSTPHFHYFILFLKISFFWNLIFETQFSMFRKLNSHCYEMWRWWSFAHSWFLFIELIKSQWSNQTKLLSWEFGIWIGLIAHSRFRRMPQGSSNSVAISLKGREIQNVFKSDILTFGFFSMNIEAEMEWVIAWLQRTFTISSRHIKKNKF